MFPTCRQRGCCCYVARRRGPTTTRCGRRLVGQTASRCFVRGIHPQLWSVCTSWRDNPRLPALVVAVECARAVTGAAGFTPLSWRFWPWGHDHPCGMFWNLSQVARREDDNTMLPAVWICDFGMRICSTLYQRLFVGHARIWPNRIWPKKSEFGQDVFVTTFGQNAFGQN